MHDAGLVSHDPSPGPPVRTFVHNNDVPFYPAPDDSLLDDDAPPSYEDTVGIVGAPPGYGTFRPYTEESSIASSEVESSDRALPEWVGQGLVVFIFISIIYGFWRFINAPDDLSPIGVWPGPPPPP
ncbi:hypothetical protein CFE70_009272 [Pyrenophora teres f. teres 0-1]|uniref:Uncharacterized protein n=2 Tax=Pyrenophora teres f. teres TaxID=97479 RepID=E3REJ4_PYRTT|nr:hypothetical protein PTT_04508 [Pyrenophora teres f. teres 0-1]KAE8824237.1 hypothetical protein HRS9139_09419 [Pyrenophora teres f. teres]KAE8827440.1 hypothetical protein PTNB85_08793 [Pyrenophora teres f. teres]KAE8831264.1 hypothetical protein HRS9122_08854 [Pyrenophora teres f. teres]KAE8855294.1 hypothetical protein PTNB29_09545 [Pyrenophora teres f. teres]